MRPSPQITFPIWNNQLEMISWSDERVMPLHREREATTKSSEMFVPEGSALLHQLFVARRSHIEGYARSSTPRSDSKSLDQMKKLFGGRV